MKDLKMQPDKVNKTCQTRLKKKQQNLNKKDTKSKYFI